MKCFQGKYFVGSSENETLKIFISQTLTCGSYFLLTVRLKQMFNWYLCDPESQLSAINRIG